MESLETAVGRVFDHLMSEVYTSIPCEIISIEDDEELRVSVKPLLKALYRDETVKDRPTILNVPVQMPSTNRSMVHMPIAVGDPVWCMFSMRALDTFKEGDGTAAPPPNFRRFHRADAIAFPGCHPFSNNPNTKRTLSHSPDDFSVANNIGTPEDRDWERQ